MRVQGASDLIATNLVMSFFTLILMTGSKGDADSTTPAPTTSGTDANAKSSNLVPTQTGGHDLATTTSPTPPSIPCKEGWTAWINHNPISGIGDREQLTAAEKLQLCSGGNFTQIECNLVDGDIPSYSSGELAECSVDRGFICNNADNFPIPCSDYKARFYCKCPASPTPTTSLSSNASANTSIPPTNSNSTTTKPNGAANLPKSSYNLCVYVSLSIMFYLWR